MYKKLIAHLSRFSAEGGEGSVRATLNRLSPDELRQIAQQIVDLHAYLEIALGDSRCLQHKCSGRFSSFHNVQSR